MRTRLPAYSLIEILIVLSIIGVILTIAVPRLVKSREVTNVIACKKEMSAIDYSLELYFTSQETYPDNLTDLVTKGFISEKALTDPWNNAYLYRTVTKNKRTVSFVLSSPGPDGVADSDDDIKYEK